MVNVMKNQNDDIKLECIRCMIEIFDKEPSLIIKAS